LTDPTGNYPIIFPGAKSIQLAYLATQAANELGMTIMPDSNGMSYVEKIMHTLIQMIWSPTIGELS
jgi:hypothetical protein